MTESEWLAATDPEPMIWIIRKQGTERRQRLAACACCRTQWAEDRRSPRSRAFEWVFDCSERYADGQCDEAEARAVFEKAMDLANPQIAMQGLEELEIFKRMVRTALCANPLPNAPLSMLASEEPKRTRFFGAIRKVIGNWLSIAEAADPQAPRPAIWCHLIRDIFGNPFRPVTLNSAWLTWHDGLLVSMAQWMYDSRDFGDMPVLADALEEAGCSDFYILNHCREPGEHVRGCHVVDLCLGWT